MSFNADFIADNTSTVTNTSPTSSILAVISQDENVMQSPVIEINTKISN